MAKLADARDLKSRDTRVSYRFDPGFRHHYIAEWSSPVARRAHNPKVMWFKSHLRNQTKEKQPIGLFFLLSGYEDDERGSLCQRSQNAMGMAFWQAVSSKARVFGRAACRARKTTRDEDGREAITRRSCGSNPSRLRARSPYGSKVPKGTLFTTVRSFRFASLLRNQTKEKQPIGLFFLLSGYENDERGSLCQRSRKAIGMAF